jgi:hypothetical protein
MRLSRQIKNRLLLLPMIFAAQEICAQIAPAGDFFNSGAQFYISNNIPAALERAESGLQLYADDEKLKKLEKLLKQQQSQQQQNQSQQNSKDQKNQQQQNQQSPQKNSQDQQKQDEQKQEQAGEKKGDQQKQADKKKGGDKQDKQNAEGQPVAAGQMTPEEAKRLLDAQKGDEQVLQLKPQGKPEQNHPVIKDW